MRRIALPAMAGMTGAVLLLGGNLGEVNATLAAAERAIGERAGGIRARSRDHWTRAWGFKDERLFLNRAVLIDTHQEPRALLSALLGIEADLGRVRSSGPGYHARTIDIDILLFGDEVIDEEDLRIPHPRVHERGFALAPAADIVPHWSHPVLHRTVLELLDDLHRTGRTDQ